MLKWMFFYLSLTSMLWGQDDLKIGSKRFTESYILGEILYLVASQADEAKVEFKSGLGNTGIAFSALQEGLIDLYPEYTGTIINELLKTPFQHKIDLDQLRSKLMPLGIGADIPFGFDNSYALAMPEEQANRLDIKTISDLARYPQLKLGFSHEFLSRADGWEALKKAYHLPQKNVVGIDHSLSYEALDNHQIDLTDIYTTDPKIEKYHLKVLEDDRHFFPPYEALILYRLSLPQKFPKTWEALKSLEGKISEADMQAMNAKAELSGVSFEHIAQDFLVSKHLLSSSSFTNSSASDLLFGLSLWPLLKQHLFLVFGSLIPAIFIGVLLGIIAAKSSLMHHIIINSVSFIQTIPSLALFAFLIPILQQIGTLPALIVLFLYALLPIVHNTISGLNDIPEPLKESAIVLGLPWMPRLFKIEIPLALRSILTGIKTAAVINVGMATIAALIGAGGFGERIITGLALNNYRIILSGAIPVSLLAILVQLAFSLLGVCLIPKKLK